MSKKKDKEAAARLEAQHRQAAAHAAAKPAQATGKPAQAPIVPPKKQTSRRQQLEQERAAHAWERIPKTKEEAKKVASLAKGFPAQIVNSGLGPSLAFLRAKGKAHHLALYGALSDWLTSGARHLRLGGQDALAQLMSCDGASYRAAATESLAYLNWFRRLATAQAGGEEAVDQAGVDDD